ncbi:MAG: Phage integrase family protein [Verrucomicrobiaceae bacterium]|nr:Phage integrase family protein [Verrucomicrobiaceae bacterium]
MPKTPHVFRRGGVYYVRKRVPSELVEVLKRTEIRVSLKTSDYGRAMKQAPYAQAQLAGQFDEARRKAVPKVQQVAQVHELQDSEIHQLVATWFVREEAKNETWWETEAKALPSADLATIWDNVTGDLAHYQTDRPSIGGGLFGSPVFDPSGLVAECLSDAGIALPSDSPSFAKLGSLLRRALVETTERKCSRLMYVVPGVPVCKPGSDPYFQSLSAHSPPPVKRRTLGELLVEFKKHHEKRSAAGTARTYEVPIRLLQQFFTDACPLSAIDPEKMRDFFDLLEKVPVNAQQRYRGLSLKDAIAAAEKVGDVKRLGAKTLANYLCNVVAIFNFGKELKMVEDNPASVRFLRERYSEESEEKSLFSIDELNKLFSTPLYTGCVDDARNYAKPGSNVPRRGRFWVPLLALFQGSRLNELCELFVEDVKEEEGVWFVSIRPGTDGNSKAGKRLKTKQSRRRVPIHHQLIKMGFLEYVRERAKDGAGSRLFPELPPDSKGYRSGLFSKWFGHFTDAVLPRCKATFHSFRHQWRTQLTRSNVSIEDAEQLGGWGHGKRSSERLYSHGQTLAALKAAIDRVEYAGLDLGHLVPQRPAEAVTTGFPKRFPHSSSPTA